MRYQPFLVAGVERWREYRAQLQPLHRKPVLFVMMSNHYAFTYGHRYNWALLIALSVAGALIRVWFVDRHKGKQTPLTLVVDARLG